MKLINLVYYHWKIYSRNSYFVTLLISTTLSFTSIEFVMASIYNSDLVRNIWLAGGVFGFWNLCVTSAGSINFQKRQQTLTYLVNNEVSDLESILSLLIAPATFGLLAFPISYVYSIMLGNYPSEMSLSIILAIILLYIGGIILSLLIASVFILTKNAIIYEKLLVVPILIISGLLVLPNDLSNNLNMFEYIVPISAPIKYLIFGQNHFILKSIISILISGGITFILFKKLLKIAKKKALLEVI